MSDARRLFLAFATGLGFTAMAAAPAAAEQGVTADSVNIGAFGPITGPAAYIGLAGRDGAGMAIKEINAAGGVNGRKLNMIFEDDGHSPA
jgi:branched-chain amino acid transport system substrate-binding protein